MQPADQDEHNQAMTTMPWLGAALVIVAVGLIASMDGIAKFLSADLPILEILWARYFFHAVFITLAVALSRRGLRDSLRTRRPGLQIARTLALLAATSAMYLALTRISLGEVTAILFLNPIAVTVLSVLVLGERIGRYRIAAVLAGFLGVLLVIQPSFDDFDPYLLLPLFSALMLAVFYMLTRALAGPDEGRAALFLAPAGGALVLSVMMPFHWQQPEGLQWLLLPGLGGLGAAGHFLLQSGFRFASVSALSPFLYAQVVFAALISAIAFDVVPNALTVIGTVLIVGGGLIIWKREARKA